MARRVDLIYGPSGAGKSSFLLDIALHVYQTTGKKTVWNLADGGGETIYNSGFAGADGFIKVHPFHLRAHPLETCQLLCDGYIPKDWDDPASPLVKPTAAEAAEIGLWCFEGLTFMSDYMMGDKEGGMAWRQAKGQGFNKDQAFQLKDGNIAFGNNGRSDFGFVQRRILDLVDRAHALPSNTVLFTAHERRIDDEENRETIFGPDVCGKALTARIGGSFGNTLHLQKVHVTKKVTDPSTKKTVDQIVLERRLYTRDHVDPEAKTFVKYFANSRVPRLVAERYPDFMPEYFAPADPVAFYRKLQEAEALNTELAQALYSSTAQTTAPVVLL